MRTSARSTATRQSQHNASTQPPAIAWPFTHATVGPAYS
jgi:hypothetical protein